MTYLINSEQDGAEIHRNLATIVQTLLRKRILMKTKKVTRAKKTVKFWLFGIIFQREHLPKISNSRRYRYPLLLKGWTAVVQVVNDLISKPEVQSKGQVVLKPAHRCMAVLLMANANIELNLEA